MEFDVYDYDESNNLIFIRKKLYSNYKNNINITKWLKNRFISVCKDFDNKIEVPYMTSAVTLDKNLESCVVPNNFLGYVLVSNVFYRVTKSVYLLSSVSKGGGGFIVLNDLFDDLMVSLGVERACFKVSDLYDDRDTFFAPAVYPLPDDFVTMCVIYALFDCRNLTCSIRNQKYKVFNNFFPFKHSDFIRNSYLLHLRNILIKSKPTFVYNWIEQKKQFITGDVATLLDIGKQIYQLFFDSYPHIDLLSISLHQDDANPGWYQVRNGLSGSGVPPEIQKQFKSLMKQLYVVQRALARTIADRAYEYGFIVSPVGNSSAGTCASSNGDAT